MSVGESCAVRAAQCIREVPGGLGYFSSLQETDYQHTEQLVSTKPHWKWYAASRKLKWCHRKRSKKHFVFVVDLQRITDGYQRTCCIPALVICIYSCRFKCLFTCKMSLFMYVHLLVCPRSLAWRKPHHKTEYNFVVFTMFSVYLLAGHGPWEL